MLYTEIQSFYQILALKHQFIGFCRKLQAICEVTYQIKSTEYKNGLRSSKPSEVKFVIFNRRLDPKHGHIRWNV